MHTFLHAFTATKTLPFHNVKSSHHENFGIALTFGWFGDAFLSTSMQKLTIFANPIATFYKVGTTQNTQQPTEPPPPYPPGALSSHSMGTRSAVPTTHGVAASRSPILGARGLVWWRHSLLACLEGGKQHTPKNREEMVSWPEVAKT